MARKAGLWRFNSVAVAGGIGLLVGLGGSNTLAMGTDIATGQLGQLSPERWNDLAFQSDPITGTEVNSSADGHTPHNFLAQAISRSLYEQGRYSEALSALQGEIADLEPRSIQRAAALGNLALLQNQLGESQAAIATVTQALQLTRELSDRTHVTADLLSLRGQLELSQGKAEQALSSWESAEKRYEQLQRSADMNRSRIAQAQALQRLGFYRRALQRLEAVSDRLQSQPDGPEKVMQLQALGDSLQLVGDGQQAKPLLLEGLALAQKLDLASEESSIALSLGNGAAAQNDLGEALRYYEQAIATATNSNQQLQGQINQFSLRVSKNDKAAADMIPLIQQNLAKTGVSDSYGSLQSNRNAQLKFGNSLAQLPGQQDLAQQVLQQAHREAQAAKDLRSQSYALGYLGSLYQQQGQITDALMLTRQALELAQSSNAPEIAYRWNWQLGQLLKQEWQFGDAIIAYDRAIADLEILRGDLTAVNRDVQFSFRESVEPVYRESVALLLEADPDDRKNLDKARQRIEALQLAELDNFFREACLDAQSVAIDQVVDQDNPTAAVIYPIILDDRMEVIAKIPRQPLQRYSINQSQSEIEALALELQEALLEPDETLEVQELSQTLHQWLVEPLESQLEGQELPVDTLVFVLDGPLRSLPMAALYDGEQYLVEKYAIALSLGLQLLDPRPLAPQELGVLAAGLAEVPVEYRQFPPLPEVPGELALINATIAQGKGQTKQLLNQDFTQSQLAASVRNNPFNVLHLATHGQFSSRAEDTFVLAADGPINVNQFDDLLRQRETSQDNPIELLVLSACQTAVGDNRATLGLAGVAVRAGARSTLASLWNIGDRSTSILIGEFYRELAQGNVTKAEALRRAQVTLLRDYPNYARPTYWAPYVLVGNWL